MFAAPPPPSAPEMVPQARFELSFSCKKLKNLDFLSKSDPIVLVYVRTRGQQGMTLMGQTEIIADNLNPEFVKTVLVDYYFEEEQTFQIKVLDVDKDKTTFKDADFIGQAIFNLGALCSARGQQMSLQLRLPDRQTPQGMITIRAEEAATGENSGNTVLIDASAVDLKPQHSWKFWRTQEPAFRILRIREDGRFTKVAETEKFSGHDSRHPRWAQIKIKNQKLCNADPHRVLELEVTDLGKYENGETIGSCRTNLNDMCALDGRLLSLTRDKKEVGKAKLTVQILREPSFFEYIRGGIEIKLHVAIDFTASNGNPMQPNSLHFMGDGRPNCYQQIVNSVGSILLDYDSDKMVPAYGFGGMVNGSVNHAFPLTLNPHQVEVAGLQGMQFAYQNALRQVALSGPTLFCPIISQTNQFATAYQQQNAYCYNILLIITDGVIHDLDQTINAVVQASYLPVSIIIVGVGNADFSAMHALDADGGELKAKGQLHDNVQFVPYNDVANSASRLAREVLAELPEQAVHYFMRNKMMPPQPTVATCVPVDIASAPVGLPEQYLVAQHTSNFAGIL